MSLFQFLTDSGLSDDDAEITVLSFELGLYIPVDIMVLVRQYYRSEKSS